METQQILGDRYELRRRIGVGGMAAVFLAHDRRLDRDVAVKVLDMAGVTDHTFVERFRREARAAAAINHPNVVSVYDWGEIGDPVHATASIYYLVMEYVPGPNLKEKVQREGPLSEDEALRIGIQIAAALEAAHARGLIHRDIKSQNVLIDSSGNAKVADFGIAYLEGLTHLTQTNAVSGSAHYISPEQAQGKRVDARTDIYSLGIVLYEMLTGRVPFDGESMIDVALHQVQDAPIPVSRLRPTVSVAAEAVVATAMAKNPDDRFAGAADLRAALERARAALATRPASIEPRPTPEVVVERVPRTAPPTRSTADAERQRNTVALGAGVPVRRPRVRGEEHRSRWWILAVPVLLLALVGGALAMHALPSGGTSAAPPRTTSKSGGSTARAAGPAATATRGSGVRATSTASQPTVPPTRPPAPRPTTPSRAVVPTTPPAPAVVPPAAITRPTSVANSATSGATSPDGAVLSFYEMVTRHQYAAAAALWSSNMRANYPPSTNIYGRFDQTQGMNVQITNIDRGNGAATVGVNLTERKTDGTVARYVGSWHLVQGASGWLLDSVDLTPAQASNGAALGQIVQNPGKHKGHGAKGSDG